MRRLLVVLLLAVLFSSLVYAATPEGVLTSCPTGKCDNDKYCIYFFYGQGCPHCANVEPLIAELEQKYTNFSFYNKEIYFNSTNQELFQDFVLRYGIQKAGIPAVFISDKAMIGDVQIKNNLENTIKTYLNNTPICPLTYNIQEPGTHEISPTKNIKLTVSAVIIAAFADSINPCAFAVLIFLLMYLSSIASKKRMIKIGVAYIITIFIVYFLSGLGIFIFVQKLGFAGIVFKIAAWISILAGVINVKDFFWYGKGITLAIPEKAKPLTEKYIKFATIPAAIILGVLVSMFELPCTGGVYLAILSLLANNLSQAAAIPWLLLYNLIFVLPLILILLIVIFGVEAGKADKVRLEKRKWLKLAMGLIMIILGVAMLFGVFG